MLLHATRIITFDALCLPWGILVTLLYFEFVQVIRNYWLFRKMLEGNCKSTWTGQVLSKTKEYSLLKERGLHCQRRCQTFLIGCAVETFILIHLTNFVELLRRFTILSLVATTIWSSFHTVYQMVNWENNEAFMYLLTLIYVFLDIRKQNHELASTVHQIRGHIKGRTLLPFPQQGTAAIEDEEAKVRASEGKNVNMMLKNTIEGIILKWAHQVTNDNSQMMNLMLHFILGWRSSQ